MDYESWMLQAKQKISQLPVDKSFSLRELFDEANWNTLSKGERQGFGRFFRNEVTDNKVDGVVYLMKSSAVLYKKNR